MLRWLGVRYVPHLPCGFRCDGTIELGRRLRALIPKPERDWMDELLSMPMLWSSLHGIGEVVTPVVTLNFRTEVSHESQEIRREGQDVVWRSELTPTRLRELLESLEPLVLMVPADALRPGRYELRALLVEGGSDVTAGQLLSQIRFEIVGE